MPCDQAFAATALGHFPFRVEWTEARAALSRLR